MAEIDKGEAFDWDDDGVPESNEYRLLDAGVYAYEVAKIERERFDGSDKMAPCPRARVSLNVWTPTGWVSVSDRIALNTKFAWRVSNFFEGLGYVTDPSTGKMPMPWAKAEGKQGYLELDIHEWQSNGETRQSNEVKKYLKPSDWPSDDQPQQPAAPEPVAPEPVAVQTSMPVPPQPTPEPRSHQSWDM